MRKAVLRVVPEVIRPMADVTQLAGSKADTRDKRAEAARALQEALDQFIARITEHLKAAGATDEELRAARPGLVSARLALDPVEAALTYLGVFTLTAVPIAYVGLADIPEFVRRGGFLFYPLFWSSDWNQGLAEATRYVFGIGAMLGVLLLSLYHNPLTAKRVVSGPTLAQLAARQSRRLAISQNLGPWLFIPNLLGSIILMILLWRWSISAISLERGSTWWDGVLVALSSVWSLVFCSFLFRRLPALMDALLCYRFPGFALLRALSEALDAVRDRHLWFDVEHRFLVARELARAADILEGPMLRRFIEETGDRGGAVLGPRLATTAAAVRQKLIWVATPMSETREDLERFLRDAVIAAATGQIDRIGSGETMNPEPTVARFRVWLMRLVALAKGAVIAALPIGLLWLALKLGLMTLSSEADRATAQNAAMLWFVLSIVRTLDPGGFKDVSDVSGSWTERFSHSFGKGPK